MRRNYRHYAGTWYRRWRGGLYPSGAIALPWGRYERHAYLFWRIRIPLWLGGGGVGWALAGPGGVVGGLVAAYAVEAIFSFRRTGMQSSAPRPASPTDAEVAAARSVALRWETEAVPSPGGWRPPEGVFPAWSWTPPGGISLRLDRVPGWARLWHKTPLIDRFAHAWMWEHGGWDVLPPGPGTSVSER